MLTKTKSENKWWLTIFLAILLLTEDFGTLFVFSVTQYIMLALFAILLLRHLFKEKTIKLPLSMLSLLLYMLAITLINKFNFDSITDFVYFCIALVTIYWLIKEIDDIETIERVFYHITFIISLIGIAQFVANVFGFGELFDLNRIGISQRFTERYGFVTALGVYTEPAHSAPIMAWAVWVALIGKEKNYNFVKLYKTIPILLFSVLTQSTMTLVTVFAVFAVYVFIYQKRLGKKMKYIVLGCLALAVIMAVNSDFIIGAVARLRQFETISTTTRNDLSALALVSNLNIAIEKMKDGYIFGTGFDSHQMYYDKYIAEIYGQIIMAVNKEDCASLYIRIFSEFGIIGFLIFVIVVVKNSLNLLRKEDRTRFVFIALFLIIILRYGDYVNVVILVSMVLAFFNPLTSRNEVVIKESV